jgi:hypothetical protein
MTPTYRNHAYAAALLVAGFALPLSPASAQQAPAPGAAPAAEAPAPRPAVRRAVRRGPPKNATELVLVNTRSSPVNGMSLVNGAGLEAGKLQRQIDPGKRTAIKLVRNAGCTFSLTVSFEDGAEFEPSDVNLCTDKTVRLTE